MDKYIVSPSPHIHANTSSSKIMGEVCIALLPALAASIAFYGVHEILVILVSVVSCVAIEWAISKFLLKETGLFCGSAATVTGILLAMNLPSNIPLWIVFIGAVIAIGVGKMTFGGLGQNIFNPALVGRVFLLVSFPQQMTDWTPSPGFIHATDAISGATLLGVYGEGGMSALTALGYPESHKLFMDIGGSAGEVSIAALLIGFVYLLVRKVVKPWIPLAILGTVTLISGIFHLVDPSVYTGPLFNLLTGGMVMGACFMATDYVTSPMSTSGGIVFGIGIGFLVMMIRYFGSYPEGVSFAILIMNMTVPLLNRWFHQKKYGRA